MKWRHIFFKAIVPILFLQVLSAEAAVKTEEDIFVEVKLRELTERIRKAPKDVNNWYAKGTYSYIAGDLPQANWTIGNAQQAISDYTQAAGYDEMKFSQGVGAKLPPYPIAVDDRPLSNDNAATYYQQREYIAESFLEGSPIDI